MQQKKKDYIWNLIGTVMQSAISPVLLIVVTQYSGLEASGLFSFAVSVSVVFWAVSLWGGRTYQVSDVTHEFSSGGYIMVRSVASILASGMAVAFCVVGGYDETKTGIIMLLTGFKILESFADVLYGILQRHHRLYISGISLTLKAWIGFAAFIIANTVTKNLLISSSMLLFTNLLLLLTYDRYWVKQTEHIAVSVSHIRRYTRQAFYIMKRTSPVFFVMFLTMFSLNIPRYFLDKYHPDQTGYFGIMAMPITLLALLVSFIIQPNLVDLSKQWDAGKVARFHTTVKRMLGSVGGLGLVALIATYAVGVEALHVVFGVQLVSFRSELLVMILGAVATALLSILVTILIVMRHFKGAFYSLLITDILLGAVSPMIIFPHAMMGAVGLFTGISTVQVVLLGVLYMHHIHGRRKVL